MILMNCLVNFILKYAHTHSNTLTLGQTLTHIHTNILQQDIHKCRHTHAHIHMHTYNVHTRISN